MTRSPRILGLIGLLGMSALAPCHGSTPPPGAVSGYSVGNYAFDFPALDQNGNSVTLYQYYGTYVVLDFAAVWCGPCTAMTPALDQSATALNNSGIPETTLDFLLEDVSGLPSTAQGAQRWAAAFHLAMPVLNVGGAPNSVGFSQMLNYAMAAGQPEGGFPTLVIMSPTLKILSVNVGTPISPDQMPTFLHQIIQADLASDPSSGLAEAVALTQRRIDATQPFPLKPAAGTEILNALGRIQRNVVLERTEVACVQSAALTLVTTAAGKALDAVYSAQLRTLMGDVRTALQCGGWGL